MIYGVDSVLVVKPTHRLFQRQTAGLIRPPCSPPSRLLSCLQNQLRSTSISQSPWIHKMPPKAFKGEYIETVCLPTVPFLSRIDKLINITRTRETKSPAAPKSTEHNVSSSAEKPSSNLTPSSAATSTAPPPPLVHNPQQTIPQQQQQHPLPPPPQ